MALRALLALCVMLMLSVARANVITACSAEFTVPTGCDGDGCTYNASYVATGDSVAFTVTARTNANTWVGIGFSLTPTMPNSEVVVGAYGNNPFVEDRYVGAARIMPTLDPTRDISDIVIRVGNGLVGIEFTRPRVTAASNAEDISLDQPVYFLGAWGGSVTFGTPNMIGQHNNDRRPSNSPYMIPADCGVITACSAEFSLPTGCVGDDCTYNASYVATGDSVAFSVTARTNADTWVGIGFSLTPSMPNSEVVVGAVDGNNLFVEDRYVGAARVMPTLDQTPDISDTSAWAGNGLVGIEFTRPRVTAASNAEDISLDQPVYFLGAWGGSVTFGTPNMIGRHNDDRRPSNSPYRIPANCGGGSGDDDDDDDEDAAGVTQASFLVLALMAVVTIFGF